MRSLCVRCGSQLPPPRDNAQFSAHVSSGQMAGWIKVPLGMEIGLGSGDIVLDGDQLPLSKKGGTTPPNLWPMYCGQTAGWINRSLAMVVDLGPWGILSYGDQAPPKRGNSLPILGPCVLWSIGYLDTS